MSLGERLLQARPPEKPTLPALKPILAATERVLQRWPDVVPNPPERDREQLVLRMKAHLDQNRWDGVQMSLVSAAARALFDEVRRQRSDLAGLRTFYLEEIRASTSTTFLGAMISVYLESFVPNAPHTRDLAEALHEIRHRMGARWRMLIDSVPEILRPDAAPDAIARKMVGMKNPCADLKELGLRSPHAPGLMDFAHLAYVARLEPHLSARVELDRLFAWLKPDGQASARMSGASEAIDAVLGHWRTSNPSDDDLSFLTQSLVGLYDDPRVQRGGAWAGVASDRLAVIMRWLTGENIRFFMDVVSAVEDSHMWEPRRRFWLKLHAQRRIDAAWVAFSPSGALYARRMLASRGTRGVLNYGRQSAGGARVNTSLLILKSGSKIIVEGSHSYKVHIFRDADPRAPTLYQQEYDCERIRLTPGAEAKAHLGDWQSWVEERI
ncbi:EH signature domain-containing protein [Methylobacterium oxalidis]|uniref:EH signature domain-containing protein n=1 Tax=Methylobacterium oxalidis TaxID=944322 RepID=UPI003315F268